MLLANIYAWYDILHYYVVMDMKIIMMICIGSVITSMGIYYFMMKMNEEWINKHIKGFTYFTIHLLCSILIVDCLKEIKGRIRYRDLVSPQDFQPWYSMIIHQGNYSFPSGHTCAFTSLLWLLDDQKILCKRNVMIWIFVILMPLTRFSMGAHYLSDTIFGFMISYMMYLILKKRYMKEEYKC